MTPLRYARTLETFDWSYEFSPDEEHRKGTAYGHDLLRAASKLGRPYHLLLTVYEEVFFYHTRSPEDLIPYLLRHNLPLPSSKSGKHADKPLESVIPAPHGQRSRRKSHRTHGA